MSDRDDSDWENASWEGSRRALLRASLKLSAKERFEALEYLARTSDWLVSARFPDGREQDSPTQGTANLKEPSGEYRKGENGTQE